MDEYVGARGSHIVEIQVTARVFGHENPWPSGTIVTFSKHMSVVGGQGYRRLDVHKTDDDRWVRLPYESVGIISDHKYAVEEFANQVNVSAGKLDNIVHQWYWVAFQPEILWVRCDWLRPWNVEKRDVGVGV